MNRNRKLAVLTGLTTAVAIALPTAVAATPSCAWGITPNDPVAVAVRGHLAADGEVTDVSRAISGADHCWAATAAPEADDLPVDVAVLYRDADGRSLEASELGNVDGLVHVRVAVRDRTSATRVIAVDAPLYTEDIVERIGAPQLVEVGIELPSGWEDVRPATAGARVDVRHDGLRVRHTGLLFPPLTDDEMVVELTVRPGQGVPTVAVSSTPAGQDVPDEISGALDRETAAVIAAINELSADGASQLADGASQLADGAARLAAGMDELAAGLAPLADGAGQVADGIDELAHGLAEAADGAHQIADGNDQIAESVRPLAEGAQAFHDGVVEARDTIAAVLASGEIDQATMSAMADALVDVLTDIVPAELHQHLPTADELAADPATFAALIPAELVEYLLVPLDEMVAGVGALNADIQELYGGLRALADGSRELAEGLDDAVVGTHQLADGAHQVADGIRQAAGGVDQLRDGAHQLADGADALSAGAAQLPEGMREAAAIADRAGRADARTEAIIAAGARSADTIVRTSRGDAAGGVVAFELTTAGDKPLPLWSWTLIGSITLSMAAVATIAWRRRQDRHARKAAA